MPAVFHTKDLSNALRILALDAAGKAKSGHLGLPLGMADVATVLFTKFLKFDPQKPFWPERDRFILSAGHGSLLLYGLLYLTGYPVDLEDIKNFRQLHSNTPGHPEYRQTPGVEATTGPLGQGIAMGVGMALAEKLCVEEAGDHSNTHKIYIMAGDGCLMEGISYEAISLAGHLKLSQLVILFDDNQITIDGKTDLSTSENIRGRFESCGWNVLEIDGHQFSDIENALEHAQTSTTPTIIACRTRIGYGVPGKEGTAAAHGGPFSADEVAAARVALGWPWTEPFYVPENILDVWRAAGKRYATFSYNKEDQKEPILKEAFSLLKPLIRQWAEQKFNLSTRQFSQLVLDFLFPHMPFLLGGSADLTNSTHTCAMHMTPVAAENKTSARYIHYGIREHAMAAIMNGIALDGRFAPYGGTFLAFSDYSRPAIRLAALMGLPVIHVMTHDSIGVGEDGPTHQPIEQLASLRAIPQLNVFRPADGVEVGECWALALQSRQNPSILALSRQVVSSVRNNVREENLCAYGAYILKEATHPHQITLLATGSEVILACQVQERLEKKGQGTRVVSMPCWRLFDQQPEPYRLKVLHSPVLCVSIEAASSFGWERYIYTGPAGLICGIENFGLSAPFQEIYAYFNLTVEKIIEKIEANLPSNSKTHL